MQNLCGKPRENRLARIDFARVIARQAGRRGPMSEAERIIEIDRIARTADISPYLASILLVPEDELRRRVEADGERSRDASLAANRRHREGALGADAPATEGQNG